MPAVRIAVLAAVLAVAAGLREEDAGRWDWQKQLFKGVTDAKVTGKRVYLAADGVMGAVSKTGATLWRRKIGTGGGWIEKVTGGILHLEKTSGKASLFTDEGALTWEGTLPQDTTPLGISGETGEEWPAVLSINPGTNKVTVHPIHLDGHHVKFGTVAEVPSPAGGSATYHASQGVLYAITKTCDLHELQLSSQQWMAPKKLPFKLGCEGVVVTHSDAASLTLYSKSEGTCYEGGEGFAESNILKCVPGRLGQTGSAPPEEVGEVSRVWAVKVQGGGVKTLVKYATGDLALLSTWRREDGLAEATTVKAYDIPADVNDDAELSDAAEYADLVAKQVEAAAAFIKDLPRMTTDAVNLITTGVKAVQQYDSRETAFGLQKILLFNSKQAVYSLNTKDGSQNWQVSTLGLIASCPADAEIKDVLVLTSVHVQHSHPKVFVLVSSSAGDALVEVCPEKGTPTAVHKLNSKAGLAFKTEKYLHHGYHTVVIVDREMKGAAVYPEGAEKVSEGDLIRCHTFSRSTGEARGYLVTKDLAVEKVWGTTVLSTSEEKVAATSLDTYNGFGYVNTDAIHVHGNHSTGKNEVLNKYVNPNAFVVVTTVPQRKPVDETTQDGPKREGYLVLYLVDGITGAILSSMVQTNAGGKVSVVALEHMYLYSFFNMKRKRYQLGVWSLFKDIDLYTGMTSESTTSLKYIMQATMGLPPNTYSSYEEASPRVIPAAFTFPAPVEALGVTVSEKGVATKQLLVSLATDELVTVDIQKHIAANMEQGNTLVSWLPTSHLTYNLTAVGVTSITTFPTKLESTCLVVGKGSDIFFSRTTSGKPFDVLPEDFEYTLLLLLTLGILVTTVVLSVLSKSDALKSQWL